MHSDNPHFRVDLAGGQTYVSFRGIFVHDLDHVLYVGAACGIDAQEIGRGLSMSPVRLYPDDPDAEDPSLVCERSDGQFFRIDLDGRRPPELLLPRFNCYHLLATPHGPVIGERHRAALWHLPNFPDDAGAVEISAEADGSSAVWLDGRVIYVDGGGIRGRDLVTGGDALLVPDAVSFLHTDTHLLWRARAPADAETAALSVYNVATGEGHGVGLHRFTEDNHDWDDPGPGWRFDADGAHILHLPNVPDSRISAFDLTGAEVPIAGEGVRLAYPPVGGVVVQDGLTFRHATAGSATGTALEVPDGAALDDLEAFHDHLELRVGGDLYSVPLGGGPATRLMGGVSAVRTRVDEHLLLTLADRDLVLVHQPSGARALLAREVETFVHHPGHGVYYSRLGDPEAVRNGVWLLTDEALRARFADCQETCP